MMRCIIADKSLSDFEERKSSERNASSGIVIECGTLTILTEGSDISCCEGLES